MQTVELSQETEAKIVEALKSRKKRTAIVEEFSVPMGIVLKLVQKHDCVQERPETARRSKKILQMNSRGMTNRQIASKLSVRIETVSSLVSRKGRNPNKVKLAVEDHTRTYSSIPHASRRIRREQIALAIKAGEEVELVCARHGIKKDTAKNACKEFGVDFPIPDRTVLQSYVVARMLLEGIRQSEIAVKLSMTPQRVEQIKRNVECAGFVLPEHQSYLKGRRPKGRKIYVYLSNPLDHPPENAKTI